MTDLIESAGANTTTIMAGFTSMMAMRTIFIITSRKTSEYITKSAAEKITNIISGIIIAGGPNILSTPRHPAEMRIGRNETYNERSEDLQGCTSDTKIHGMSLLTQIEMLLAGISMAFL
jgi:hypothetical protein